MLGKIANANVLAVGTFAGQQRDFFAKGFQQRGFTGAVGAQQADAMTRYDRQANVGQQGFGGAVWQLIAKIGLIQCQQRRRHLFVAREFKAERRVDVGRSNQLHPLQFFQAALGLLGFGGLGLEAGNKLFDFGHTGLLLLEQHLLLGQFFGTNAFVGAVVARVHGQLLVVQVDNMIGHTVDEIAVVGNKQQGARVFAQVAFQPQGRFQIQVVGGFVQQQQVGRHHQCLSQIQTNTPATGEVFYRTLEIGL